jgi:hypothetical protein
MELVRVWKQGHVVTCQRSIPVRERHPPWRKSILAGPRLQRLPPALLDLADKVVE